MICRGNVTSLAMRKGVAGLELLVHRIQFEAEDVVSTSLDGHPARLILQENFASQKDRILSVEIRSSKLKVRRDGLWSPI